MNWMKKLIAHYVTSEKFTSGYIYYMFKVMDEYKHVFIVNKNVKLKNNVDGAKIIFIDKTREILRNTEIKKVLNDCDQFIVSGLFDITLFLPLLPQKILKKVYIHFWGGDFYCLREKADWKFLKNQGLISFIKQGIKNSIRCWGIKRSKAVVTLINEDYDELLKLIGVISKKHYTAPMPGDGTRNKELAELENLKKNNNPYYIQIGNSATIENFHFEAIDILSKFASENIRILCPLSYGSKEYAKKVIEYGNKIFGDKFCPLTEFMPRKEYFNLLAQVKVAIFNNDRQQAMGNISAFLRLGCKVYLRNGTAMWKYYNRRGYFVCDISDIYNETFATFVGFDYENIVKNQEIYNEVQDSSNLFNAWKNIFEETLD